MQTVYTFVKGNEVELLAIAYFACLILSHIPGPVGTAAKWLVSGKLLKPPTAQ